MSDYPVILYIETSTEVCSVAVSKGADIAGEIIVNEPKAHAKIISPIIEKILKQTSLTISSIDAVAVSEGPGSYTGLRVGVSMAKGLCYGAGKPLISVGTLDIIAGIAAGTCNKNGEVFKIAPMIDARRMEVYTATFNSDGKRESDVEALVVEPDSFNGILEGGKVLFCGNGANKVSNVIVHQNAVFSDINASAGGMLTPALEKFHNSDFADVAYFEPFYLKDFIAGVSKKSLL